MRFAPIADAATLLVRALRRSARAAGCDVEIIATAEQPWASATFSGTSHRIDVADDPRLADWLATLPDANLPIRGHIVVDLALTAPATLDILTIEDG